MNKIIIMGIIFLLVGGIVYFFEINQENQHPFDKRYQEIYDEVQEYGGAMIVKYDTETGEIISKRRADQPREEGVMTITEEEASKMKTPPENVKIIPNKISPSEAIGGQI